VFGAKSEAIALAKLTLIKEGLPADKYLFNGYGREDNTILSKGISAEITPQRALSFLNCVDFTVEFEPGELDSLSDGELQAGANIMEMSAKKLRATLAPSAKKNIVQRVVSATTTPTPTEDEKSETVETSEEADSADDSD
jgi:hypothetical protein